MPNQGNDPNFTDNAVLYTACQSINEAVQSAAYQALWDYLYRIAWQVVNDQRDVADLAQDCAQEALIRVHKRLAECNDPASFKAWAGKIVSNIAIDALRQRKRLVPWEPGDETADKDTDPLADSPSGLEDIVLEKISLAELRKLLNQAPISARSLRAVQGRYLDDQSDEILAQTESELANRRVLPSHLQVTRSKNMRKLGDWEPLRLSK